MSTAILQVKELAVSLIIGRCLQCSDFNRCVRLQLGPLSNFHTANLCIGCFASMAASVLIHPKELTAVAGRPS